MLTPQLVKRVHELYEELGREDVRAVEDWEKAERENRKDEAKAEPEATNPINKQTRTTRLTWPKG